MVRRRANTISRLQDDEGEWNDDPNTLKCMAVEFFSSLFASSDVVAGSYHLRGLFPALDQGTLHALSRELSRCRLMLGLWIDCVGTSLLISSSRYGQRMGFVHRLHSVRMNESGP
ncbi:hypothetical protein V6N13_080934 [Hibiscus sabdariffa]